MLSNKQKNNANFQEDLKLCFAVQTFSIYFYLAIRVLSLINLLREIDLIGNSPRSDEVVVLSILKSVKYEKNHLNSSV